MATQPIDRLRRWFRPEPKKPDFALVLSGGGARAAYQTGVLHYIAEAFPTSRFPIMTGVSAGAINAAHLANDLDPFPEAVRHLVDCWSGLRSENVYATETALKFIWNMMRSTAGGGHEAEVLENGKRQGWVDTSPLKVYLQEKLHAPDGVLNRVSENLHRGVLKAFAIITTSYTTGQTVSWMQGRGIEGWERPNRVGMHTTLHVDHVMASSSLPFLFPAVRIGDAWYGDGGIRLSAPLAPAIHLGADRILTISTRYDRTRTEADRPAVEGYPPNAQIVGLLMNAIFLDTLDQDALMLDRINRLLEQLPERKRMGLRPVRFLLLRPTQDIGRLSREYEPNLKGPLKLLARALSSDMTESPDWLSMLLFEPEYTLRLMEIGYEDGRRQHHRIAEFLAG